MNVLPPLHAANFLSRGLPLFSSSFFQCLLMGVESSLASGDGAWRFIGAVSYLLHGCLLPAKAVSLVFLEAVAASQDFDGPGKAQNPCGMAAGPNGTALKRKGTWGVLPITFPWGLTPWPAVGMFLSP